MVRKPDAATPPAPQDDQLMSKHRVLSFKPQLRFEWRGQGGQSETEQPDHSASLGDSIPSSTRIRFSVHTGYSFVGTVVRLEDGEDGGSNSPSFRGRLAARPLMLIGRQAVMPEVRNLIRQGRFVTLVGPSGIGGTTVAVAAGHDADVRLIAALVQALKARR